MLFVLGIFACIKISSFFEQILGRTITIFNKDWLGPLSLGMHWTWVQTRNPWLGLPRFACSRSSVSHSLWSMWMHENTRSSGTVHAYFPLQLHRHIANLKRGHTVQTEIVSFVKNNICFNSFRISMLLY